jgi:hypothetical protein
MAYSHNGDFERLVEQMTDAFATRVRRGRYYD